MKSAARPRNDTTKLRALATGLRLMTTAAPKTTVSNAKSQNRNGDISDCGLGNARRATWPLTSLLFVPFQYHTMNYSTDLEEFFLVMHHLCARVAGDGIVLAQEDRLLGANLLAHSAVDAADHVDIECLRVLLHFCEAIGRRDFTRDNLDCARRTNEFAK